MALARLCLVAMLLGCVMTKRSSADDSASSALPQYQFEVGQELIYHGTQEMTFNKSWMVEADLWQFFVVNKTSDDTWQVVVRRASHYQQVMKEKQIDAAKAKVKAALENLENKSVRRSFTQFEIDRYGRIKGLSRIEGIYSPVSHLLVSLPQTNDAAKAGWTYDDASRQETQSSHLVADSSTVDKVVFESTIDSAEHGIYEMTEKLKVTFDRNRGFPIQVEINSDQTSGGRKTSTTGTIEFIEEKKHSAEWTKACSDEVTDCFALIDAYDRVTKLRKLGPEELEHQLTEAREKLEQLTDTLRIDELKLAMKEKTAAWKQELTYRVKAAEELKDVLGTPSPEWDTTDLAGKDWSLKDLRGKVVVMDFWYRGCGWCITAMPQVKEVAEYFKSQPVLVLGMNNGDTEEDANFVIEKMKLEYPNLQAKKLAQEYKIRGFPTLLIIDQEGVIRDMHVGYSPTLKEEVIRSVEALTKAKE